MLPAHLAENIRKQVLYYLQSTFTFRDPAVERSFEQFLTDPETVFSKVHGRSLSYRFDWQSRARYPFRIQPWLSTVQTPGAILASAG